MVSFDLPHHATVDRASELLHDLAAHPSLKAPKAIMGLDANETFNERGQVAVATTARGEALLAWMATKGFRLSPQRIQAKSVVIF